MLFQADLPPLDETAGKLNPFTLRGRTDDGEDTVYGRAHHRDPAGARGWRERLDHNFERGLTNMTATHTLRDDRSVGVLNKGFDRKNCRWKEADGRAAFQGDRDTANLSVTIFWPFAGGYHVFALDQQNYGWALISDPSRSYLWTLARQPDLSVDIRNRLVDRARGLGFPVDD